MYFLRKKNAFYIVLYYVSFAVSFKNILIIVILQEINFVVCTLISNKEKCIIAV